MVTETIIKAVWNMDEAALRRIDALLTLAEIQFIKWELENLYWTLRGIRREINAKFKKEEKEIVDEEIKKLEAKRKIFLNNKNIGGEFFAVCENFYMLLTDLCKKHGLWFREGEDPRFAVLQR